MRIHALKTLPEYYQAIVDGQKTAELRLNDRDFQVDDMLVLQEYHPEQGYSGRVVLVTVTHILSGGPWLADGYCMLSFVAEGPVRSNYERIQNMTVEELAEFLDGYGHGGCEDCNCMPLNKCKDCLWVNGSLEWLKIDTDLKYHKG